jgi:hypothetical protein
MRSAYIVILCAFGCTGCGAAGEPSSPASADAAPRRRTEEDQVQRVVTPTPKDYGVDTFDCGR